MTANVHREAKFYVSKRESASFTAQGRILGNLKSRLTSRQPTIVGDCKKHLDILAKILQTKQKTLDGENKSSDIWEASSVKNVTNAVNESFKEAIATWKDRHDLDLVHYCIVFNGYKFLKHILSKELLLSTHKPTICPYAHLAAILNHSQCLQVVLTYRPHDFFIFTDEQHSLVPLIVKKQIELLRTKKNFIDRGGQFRSRIKILLSDLMLISEEACQKLKLNKDFIDTLTEGTDDLSLKTMHRKSATVSSLRSDFFKDVKSTNARLEPFFSQESVKDDTKKQSIRWKKLSKDMDRKETRQSNLGHASLHVYEEAFSDMSGVLHGVGSAIDVFQASPLPDKKESIRTEKSEIKSESSNVNSLPRFDSTNKIEKRVSLTKNEDHKDRNTNNKNRTLTARRSLIGTNSSVKNPDSKSYFLNETPLTISASRGYYHCVKVILSIIISKMYSFNNNSHSKSPLATATKAKAKAYLLILFDGGVEFEDYQNAVVVAMREQLPDSLAILVTKVKPVTLRKDLFDGENLFNVLYSKSDDIDISRLSLPSMTKALIACDEPVKYRAMESSNYPIYTLICCAFKDARPDTIQQYMTSLHILIEAGAEPDCKETVKGIKLLSITRGKFTSLSDCILTNAVNSQLSQDVVKELVQRFFVEILESRHFTEKRSINQMLVTYMKHGAVLGLDGKVLRAILQNGADPKEIVSDCGMYPVNVYFEHLFPFLGKYEVENCTEFYTGEIDTLTMMFSRMPRKYLHDAVLKFMDRQMGKAGCQAVAVVRYFCHVAGRLLTQPRTLRDLSANVLWNQKCNRNYHHAKFISRNLPEFVGNQILP